MPTDLTTQTRTPASELTDIFAAASQRLYIRLGASSDAGLLVEQVRKGTDPATDSAAVFVVVWVGSYMVDLTLAPHNGVFVTIGG